ncbi:MAG: stage V sporulation protein AD [Eubacteriales bacterium]|nr:stage V sporulation protein AD [Eubacteriales bacterium]
MKQTYEPKIAPIIAGYGTIAGPKEGEGRFAKYFDNILTDDKMGQKSYEKAEGMLYMAAANQALIRAGITAEELNCMTGGDLLNQIISSNYAAREIGAPFLGLYGACSTMAESLIAGSLMVGGGFMDRVLCVTSSHFSTAERQFRMPLEMGGQRPPTAQWTVTGSGATVLSNRGPGPHIARFTIGRVVDYGVNDANNMGAAMAPAAADTLAAHFRDTRLPLDYYDCIYTGDLGRLGLQLLRDILRADYGMDLGDRLHDCGNEMFLPEQDTHCGGSGCGCAAITFNGYLLKEMQYGNIKKFMLVATGALMSTTSSQQGESIPGIAHAVAVEV